MNEISPSPKTFCYNLKNISFVMEKKDVYLLEK